MDAEGLKSCIVGVAEDRDVFVALSGGVDSGLTAWAAHATLGDRASAVTVASELTPAREAKRARRVAESIGIGFSVVNVEALADGRVRFNGPDRCYYCKHLIFRTLRETFGQDVLFMDGTNADDDPLRPGLRALREFGVFSPLRESGLGKDAIRELARKVGLPNWDAPSESCLATRFPVGVALDPVALRAVEELEAHCHDLGVDTLRVRLDDMVAIVEHLPQYSEIMEEYGDSVVALARRIGLRSCRFKEWRE